MILGSLFAQTCGGMRALFGVLVVVVMVVAVVEGRPTPNPAQVAQDPRRQPRLPSRHRLDGQETTHSLFHDTYGDDFNYDYTYGDTEYSYNRADDTGRTAEGQPSPNPAQVAQDPRRQPRLPSRHRLDGQKMSHSIFHDTYGDDSNYDYTYGDPEYDYDHSNDTDRPGQDNKKGKFPGEEGTTPAPDKGTGGLTSLLGKLKNFWRKVVDGFDLMLEKLDDVLDDLGVETRRGLQYCLNKFNTLKHDFQDMQVVSRAEEVVEKLKGMLRRGNRRAQHLFTLLGGKVHEWNLQYRDNVVVMDVGTAPTQDQHAPNFFMDAQVLETLGALVEAKDLSQWEASALEMAAAVLATPNNHQTIS